MAALKPVKADLLAEYAAVPFIGFSATMALRYTTTEVYQGSGTLILVIGVLPGMTLCETDGSWRSLS